MAGNPPHTLSTLVTFSEQSLINQGINALLAIYFLFKKEKFPYKKLYKLKQSVHGLKCKTVTDSYYAPIAFSLLLFQDYCLSK